MEHPDAAAAAATPAAHRAAPHAAPRSAAREGLQPMTPAPKPVDDPPAAPATAQTTLRPGHAFAFSAPQTSPPPLTWHPPRGLSLPARFMTDLQRYVPMRAAAEAAAGGSDAAMHDDVAGAAPAAAAAAAAPPALPARVEGNPALDTWHPLLAPAVAWPSAPTPARALLYAAEPLLQQQSLQRPHPRSPLAPHGDDATDAAEAMLALQGLLGLAGGSSDADLVGAQDAEEARAPLPAGGPCCACGTRASPMWRRHAVSRAPLCNACGLRLMRGRPPLPPAAGAAPADEDAAAGGGGASAAATGRRLFLGSRAAAQQRSEHDTAAAAAEGATPGAEQERGSRRCWRPNPRFYGEDLME